MITLQNVSKTFRVARRGAGFKAAVHSLFNKEYSYVHALNDISFSIPDGEMAGYIGPNGAGKSSTIKIMSGILTPDSGTCLINVFMFLPLLGFLFLLPCYVLWKIGMRHYKSTGS